jgi:predicted ATPase
VIHLSRVERTRPPKPSSGFPFDIPAIESLSGFDFDAPVTLFVGENGTGKSTLLEALAIASRAITAGSAEAADDATLDGVRALAATLRLSWRTRSHRGFFLRAEDFFGFARRVATMRSEIEASIAATELEYANREAFARDLALSPHRKELAALRERYGDGLDSQSHGESFLRFFGSRLVPGGVYFLDEPEAPLSPSRQLSFLALLKEAVATDCQLVIATHSPILLSFPGASILSFDQQPIATVRYEDLEHVTLTRAFLADPQAYLRHL